MRNFPLLVLLAFSFGIACLSACKKKSDSSPASGGSSDTTIITLIDNGATYKDSTISTATPLKDPIQCSIKKTTTNSIFTMRLTATSAFPVIITISNATGPVNSIGAYKVTPVDSIAPKNISSFTEIFSGGENYSVDSVSVNISEAYGKTILGNYQMWLRNDSGSKIVSGNITCYKATIN
jgi:hypothetical protein